MCLSAVSAVVADRRLITENVDPVDAADAAKLPRLSAVYQPTTTAADEDDDESSIDSTSDTVMSSLSAVSADYASTGLHTTVTSSPLQNAESAPSASMYVCMCRTFMFAQTLQPDYHVVALWECITVLWRTEQNSFLVARKTESLIATDHELSVHE